MESLILKLDYIMNELIYTLDNLVHNFIINYTSLIQQYKHIYINNKILIHNSNVLQNYCKQIDNLILIGDLILDDIKNEFKIKY